MNIDLGYEEKDNRQRVQDAQAKKTAKDYEPTWEEVWITGWTKHTGKHKNGIFQTKLTKPDKEKLIDVKEAIENGEIGTDVETLKKFSKSHALKMYKKLKLVRREGVIKRMLENKPDNYTLVNTEERLQRVAELLRNEELIAIDTETTGLGHLDTTVGISISMDRADEHVYIPYAHITPVQQLQRDRAMQVLKPELERSGLKIVFANAKFDLRMLRKDGIDLLNNFHADVQIAMHVLNENELKYALKTLANKYGKFFGYKDNSMAFDELFSKDPQDFINADIMLATIYACKDTHLTLLLFKWQMEQFNKQPKLKHVYFDIEQKNTKVAFEMEENGFEMDLEYAEEYGNTLLSRITALQEQIKENWGDVNINSPAQLKRLFYEELGYDDPSGKGSVDAKILEKLAVQHEDVNTLIEYRKISKLYSTYIKPLPTLIQESGTSSTGVYVEGDGRLHGRFKQSGTVTGRYASSDPNLQNIPPDARNMFVAPKGKLLLGADYSQIEPRVLAHMSKDKAFSSPYVNGGDLYVQIASDVYGIPYEHCLEADDTYWREHTDLQKHPRKLAKVILLAVMYGISPFNLAGQIRATQEEAEQFIQEFYNSYPTVRAFMNKVVAHADKYGYVETADGRKRRFIGHVDVAKKYFAFKKQVVSRLGEDNVPEFIWDAGRKLPYKVKRGFWDNKLKYERVERMSVNAVIQGSAADILKKAMAEIYDHLQHKDGWRMIGTIHDEILVEIPETATPEEIRELNRIMLGVVQLDVPIKSDVEIMTKWGAGIPFEEWEEKGCGRKPFEEVK